jgi:DNA (cytosine-5)-methyltransferase 1
MNDEKNKGATDGMVLPKDGLRELALFAGAGGGILGGLLHGWRCVCAVEIEDYPRRVLLQRQADGILPRFPIWDDVRTFDGKPWRGRVDVVSGGFPCQDISAAGKGVGIAGERSGLWGEMARVVNEVRPPYVFVENSPLLVSRGLGLVLRDFSSMGYDARWGVVGAHHVGATHKRDRIWIVAHAAGIGWYEENKVQNSSNREPYNERKARAAAHIQTITDGRGLGVYPRNIRVDNAMAEGVDRLKAIGNGQVPAVAALAWQILNGGDETP